MLAIPKKFLIHDIKLINLGEDRGNGSVETETLITNVRVESANKSSNKNNAMFDTSNALIFYDNVNSTPNNAIFNINDKIIFEDKEYIIIQVKKFEDVKANHLEIHVK